jgi:hypothetical protein
LGPHQANMPFSEKKGRFTVSVTQEVRPAPARCHQQQQQQQKQKQKQEAPAQAQAPAGSPSASPLTRATRNQCPRLRQLLHARHNCDDFMYAVVMLGLGCFPDKLCPSAANRRKTHCQRGTPHSKSMRRCATTSISCRCSSNIPSNCFNSAAGCASSTCDTRLAHPLPSPYSRTPRSCLTHLNPGPFPIAPARCITF